MVINQITSYLPQKERKKYFKRASKYCANIAIKQIIDEYYDQKDLVAFDKQIDETIKFYKSTKFIFKISVIRLLARLPGRWLRKHSFFKFAGLVL
jgi:hypothetical protein